MDGGSEDYKKIAITYWLSHSKKSDSNQSCVSLYKSLDHVLEQTYLESASPISYSPIFPVFLDQRLPLETIDSTPESIFSILFLFPLNPHFLLGKLKSNPQIADLTQIYISNGLASIIILNFEESNLARIKDVLSEDISIFEFWRIGNDGIIEESFVWENHVKNSKTTIELDKLKVNVPAVLSGTTISTYVEQIVFSLNYLAFVYRKINPPEINTLYEQAKLVNQMLERVVECTNEVDMLSTQSGAVKQYSFPKLSDIQKLINSFEAQLVEICASLSYAITQGASGIAPILENPSPFPHQRLLGVGTSIKALIAFVRNVEEAMNKSSVIDVIKNNYTTNNKQIPPNLVEYQSGDIYTTILNRSGSVHNLDQFKAPKVETVPLIVHFSLRHGFKESPVSVTAAAESLSHEMEPQWTLMTLSHEIMHSRVRAIVDTIMKHDSVSALDEHFESYQTWLSGSNSSSISIKDGLRNSIYQFCTLYDVSENIPQVKCANRSSDSKNLRDQFVRHEMKVIELIVHFHDYFFIFQNDRDLYFKSIFVSWSKVSAPSINHEYYLVRAMATASIGCGLSYDAAFENARVSLLEVLTELVDSGWDCAFISKCIHTLEDKDHIRTEQDKKTYSKLIYDFKLSYYLIDQFSLFFSSIELLKTLHYSTLAVANDENIHKIGSFGDGNFINPITYCLASVQKSLAREHQVQDSRWLSAWNSMVISSYRKES